MNKNINLNLDLSMFVPTFIEDDNLFDYTHRWNVYRGSAGSGKSVFIAQKLVLKALKYPGSRTLVCRKFGSNLLESVMKEIKNVLIQFGIFEYCMVSDYNRMYRLPNDSEILFKGLDDETKLLSISDISTIWVEEAYQVEEDLMNQLNIRLRGSDAPNQLYLSFNPISKQSYLYRWLEEEPEKYFNKDELFYHTSNWRDNPFLEPIYARNLMKMKDSNYKNWLIYSENEWGQDQESIVYPHHYVANFDINKVLNLKNREVRLGLDWGYSIDPTALCVTVYHPDTSRIFIIDEHYEDHMQLDDIYEMLINHQVANTRNKFYADSASPGNIDYLTDKGVRIEPVRKTEIKTGVLFLQNMKIFVHPSCINSIKEFETYSFKKNKVSGLYYNDRFEGPDHIMDALRYAYSDLYNTRHINLDPKTLSIFKF